MNEDYINKDTVFLQGRSLGGAVAIHTITKYPHIFRGLIIENTFTSIPDMVDKIFFFLKYLKFLVLRNYWTSINIIGTVKNPILFVTGSQDELVPTEMTLKLHESATSTKFKELYVVLGGTHNDTWWVGGKEYIEKLRKFLKDAVKYDKIDPVENQS